MVENESQYMNYEATPFSNGDEIFTHAGNPDLAPLDEARKTRVAADIMLRQQQEARLAERLNTPEARIEHIGNLLRAYRNEAQGIGETVTQDELRATFNKPQMTVQNEASQSDYDLAR